MVGQFRLMPTKWFPEPHAMDSRWSFAMESATNNYATIFPLCSYDEGLGAPSALETNPENAAFATVFRPNVYPDSTVQNIFTEVKINMTKGALETDKLHAIRFMIMPIHMAFKEDYIAIDALSSEETQDILEMQTESTDQQGFPLYNNVDMPVSIAGANILDAAVPGLTTTQAIEGVTFSNTAMYNMEHYKTNGPKLRSLHGPARWHQVTRQKPTFRARYRMHSSTKRANEYMFAGLLFFVPPVGNKDQVAIAGDTTNINHLDCGVSVRYNEWNQDFNFAKA